MKEQLVSMWHSMGIYEIGAYLKRIKGIKTFNNYRFNINTGLFYEYFIIIRKE